MKKSVFREWIDACVCGVVGVCLFIVPVVVWFLVGYP